MSKYFREIKNLASVKHCFSPEFAECLKLHSLALFVWFFSPYLISQMIELFSLWESSIPLLGDIIHTCDIYI